MYVKLQPRNLNSNPYSPYSINTYICRVTITLRVHDDNLKIIVDNFLRVKNCVCVCVESIKYDSFKNMGNANKCP